MNLGGPPPRLDVLAHAEGTLFWAPDMSLPPNIKQLWEAEDGLSAQFSQVVMNMRNNKNVSIDCLMTSQFRDLDSMKPTILVICGSEGFRKDVKKKFKRCLRERGLKITLTILIDEDAGELATLRPMPALRSASDTKLQNPRASSLGPLSTDLPSPPKEPVGGPGSASRQGMLQQAKVRLLPKEAKENPTFDLVSSEDPPKTFCGLAIRRKGVVTADRTDFAHATFGGVIYAGGKLLGLTSGHLFASEFPLPIQSAESESYDTHSSDGSWQSDNSSDSVLPRIHDTSTVTRPPRYKPLSSVLAGSRHGEEEAGPSPGSPGGQRTTYYRVARGHVVAGALAGRYFASQSLKPALDAQRQYRDRCDWALLELPEAQKILPNIYSGPGASEIPIDDTAHDDDLSSGHVIVIAGKSGVLQGYLSDTRSSMVLRSHQYDLIRINLAKSLGSAPCGPYF
jgi:hypothetical protein